MTNTRSASGGGYDVSENASFQHPDQVGPFRILQVIGEGGMGVVYEAEQREPVRRQVALKMMKVGMDTKEVVGRFEAERQALAVMEHPAIAKVFDAGSSEDGRPYFVMELVHGVRLDEYCDQQRLSLRQRAELFIQVCEAVQHAHQKGVIHRDLKPSNVLVAEGAHPTPKIIDFGIAKATGQRLTKHTVVTSHGQAVGTLAYMSPEQAEMSGLDVDTRTDVYSLGAMLYELLTGNVPVDPKDVGIPSFLAQLIERDRTAATPSARFQKLDTARQETLARLRSSDADALRRELKGDLQWIVLKAMEKDRGRRYETAHGLALDLGRYLADEPIAARPPTAAYRMKKFVRRNRVGVGAVMVAVLALLAGTAAATVGLVRARRAEAVALAAEARTRQEAETARQVSEFLSGLFEVNSPGEARGNSITAREILDRGAERIETELGDQPVVQARLMATMGDVYSKLGLYREAEALLSRSLDVRERVLAEDDPEVAEALRYLGVLHSARGNYREADEALERALEILGGVDGSGAGEASTDPRAGSGVAERLRADVLSALGGNRLRQGRLDEAEPLLTMALEERTRWRGEHHPLVAVALQDLGALHLYRGDLEQAETFTLRALDVGERSLGPNHQTVASAFNNLGVMYWYQARFAEAWDAYTRAREIWESTLEPGHPRLGGVYNNLAEIHAVMGRRDEAEALFLQAMEVKERSLAPDNPSIANTMVGLANVYRDQGRFSEAEPLYRRAVRILESSLGGNSTRLVGPLVNFARSLRAAGKDAEADQVEARVRAVREGASG